MKNESNGWNFGDSFPSIEIDTNYWQTLNGVEKLQYLKRLVFQEKDFGNRINLINFILTIIGFYLQRTLTSRPVSVRNGCIPER